MIHTIVSMNLAEFPNASFDSLRDVLLEQIEAGLNPGAQLSVRVGFEEVCSIAAGVARVDSGTPVTRQTVMPFFSSAKPITAVAIGILADSGRLDFDDPVSKFIPEFSTHGKDRVTIAHLLNHTSGLADDSLADNGSDKEEVIDRLSATPLVDGWVPGERAAYLPTAGWHLLGEIVERQSGVAFDDFVQDFILDPIGMKSTIPSVDVATANELGEALSVMHISRKGQSSIHPAFTPEKLGRFTRPGSGFHGTASDLSAFYATLLNGGVSESGERVVTQETLTRLTTRSHDGILDETFGIVMDRGLGFGISSNRHGPAVPYGYSRYASDDTFGHGGKESSTGFADPDRELSVALIFNAMPGEPAHDRRVKQVLNKVYEALD